MWHQSGVICVRQHYLAHCSRIWTQSHPEGVDGDGVEEGAGDCRLRAALSVVRRGGSPCAADCGLDRPALVVAAVVADRDGPVAAAGTTGRAPASHRLARHRSVS